MSNIDAPTIDALRREGYSYSEIGARLGTTKDTARGVHRRWTRSLGLDVPRAADSAVVPPETPRGAADQEHLHAKPAVRAAGPDSPSGRQGAVYIKTDIDLARAAIAKATRAEIRLKHSLLADEEVNTVLAQRLRDFDLDIQRGYVPTIALRMVVDE